MRRLYALIGCVLSLTTPAIAEPRTLIVAADGSGQFSTVQAAVDAVPDQSPDRTVILIKPGVYKGLIHVPRSKPNVTFKGDTANPADVVLTYDLFASRIVPPATQPVGTSGSRSVLIDANDFTAENVTFENSAGEVGQAVAVKTQGDRAIFRNCRFLGWQDTLYANSDGRNYFVDCHIEGRVDFIFGRATAVFERCTIRSKNGGYVTAPSHPQEREFGYVFLECKLVSDDNVPTYLGRPWRDYGMSAFIRCDLGAHIRPEGYHHWRPEREATARFYEYKNTGPGADTSRRVPWARVLTDEEAAKFTADNVLRGTDGWNPARR